MRLSDIIQYNELALNTMHTIELSEIARVFITFEGYSHDDQPIRVVCG